MSPETPNDGLIPPDFPPHDIPEELMKCLPESESLPPAEKIEENQFNADDVSPIKQALADVGELISAIQEIIFAPIKAEIDSAILPISQFESIHIGEVSRQLDKCQDALSKCYAKQIKQIHSLLGECWMYFACAGCCYPSAEQVIYGLETGDVLGSVGLTQPAFLPAPEQALADMSSGINAPQLPFDSSAPIVPQMALPRESGVRPSTSNLPLGNYEEVPDLTSVLTSLPDAPDDASQPSNDRYGVDPSLISGLVKPVAATPQPSGPVQSLPETTREPGSYSGGTPENRHGIRAEETYRPPDVPSLPPEKPPAPMNYIPSTIRPTLAHPPFWGAIQACELMEVVPSDSVWAGIGKSTTGALGFHFIKGEPYAPEWFKQTLGNKYNPFNNLFFAIFHALGKAVNWVIGEIADGSHCQKLADITDVLVSRKILGFLNNFTGGTFDNLLKSYDYYINFTCPTNLPSQDDVDQLRVNGVISEQLWACWTKANGNYIEPRKLITYNAREKLTFTEALKLFRLGRIKYSDFLKHCYEIGWSNENDIQRAIIAEEYVPSTSDIVRMMVRDVVDMRIVDNEDLDDKFADKYSGALEEFGNANGLTRETARMYWRAHWDYPSATQAFQMLHRLRPDSPAIKKLHDESIAKGGKGLITDIHDVKRLLEINDLAPFWRERLTAISYHPLTRTDAQRAYILGALGETKEEADATLKGVFQDEGYTSENADILVRFTQELKKQRESRAAGARGWGKIKKMYIDGYISETEMRNRLNDIIPSDAKRNAMISDAIIEKNLTLRKKKIDCILKNLRSGGIERSEAIGELLHVPIELAHAHQLVDEYVCNEVKPKKLASAAQICRWRAAGLITEAEQLKRLVTIGYNLDDAKVISGLCESDISARRQKAIEAEIKRIEKESQLASKREEQLAKKHRRKIREGEI